MKIGAVVLAAGKSKRMGQNKLLLPLNGKTLIETILDALKKAKVDDCVLVLGHNPQQVLQAIKLKPQVKVAINADYDQGMVTSFQTGLKQLQKFDATFMVLGDQPIFDSSVLEKLVQILEKNHQALIVSPIHQGKKGHPLLFRNELFNELLSLKSSQTIREVVHNHVDRLFTIEAPAWTITDLDTPRAFDRLMKQLKLGQTG